MSDIGKNFPTMKLLVSIVLHVCSPVKHMGQGRFLGTFQTYIHTMFLSFFWWNPPVSKVPKAAYSVEHSSY